MANLITDIEAFVGGGMEAVERLMGPPVLPDLPGEGAVSIEEPPRASGTPEDTIASPSVRRPPVAARVATFPLRIFVANNDEFTNNPVLDQDYLVQANGQLTIECLINAQATATTLQMRVDGEKGIWGNLNGGANLILGAWFRESHDVYEGDQLNFQFGASTQATLRVTFREGA